MNSHLLKSICISIHQVIRVVHLEFLMITFSKKGGSGTLLDPYVLYSVSESVGENWYSRQIISSSDYDRDNRDRLLTNIPTFVMMNKMNHSQLLLHAGEHFDSIGVTYMKYQKYIIEEMVWM